MRRKMLRAQILYFLSCFSEFNGFAPSFRNRELENYRIGEKQTQWICHDRRLIFYNPLKLLILSECETVHLFIMQERTLVLSYSLTQRAIVKDSNDAWIDL